MNRPQAPAVTAKFIPAAIGLLLFLGCHAPVSGSTAPVTGNSEGAPAPQWTQFTDPNEHTFTVDVPAGWTVRGGLFRLGYSDERPMVDMRSPDGQINLRLGDVAVPSYALPSPNHNREGEVIDLGAQGSLVVARYRTGPEFVVLYAPSRFGQICHDPQSDASAPQVSIPDNTPAGPNSAQSSSGQITYRCTGANGPLVTFAYSRTMSAAPIWQVIALASFSAPPDKAPEARSLLTHAAQSFHLNPDWIEQQKRLDAEGMAYQQRRQAGRVAAIGQQVQQFEAKMRAQQAQVNAFEAHQAAQAQQVENFTDVLNGLTPTTNPLTGETRKVWTGTQDNYWVNGLGQVVNSHDSPGPAFTQMGHK